MNSVDLLDIQRGAVIAPAGCGKTHAIVTALAGHQASKPVLILTHTNAGASELRRRLRSRGVRPDAYRVSTIDGWAMRLTGCFPMRSGVSEAAPTQLNYPSIRLKAMDLVHAEHVTAIIAASYDRLIVDEYQDCSIRQHGLIELLSQQLPTAVLGDPLQAIFDFNSTDRMVAWHSDVEPIFPEVCQLSVPYRWQNVGAAALGEWLLEVRQALTAGAEVDLASAPDGVREIAISGTGQERFTGMIEAARCRHRGAHETSLVIGSSKDAGSRHQIARAVPGMITIEPVDLKPVVQFAQALRLGSGGEANATLRFAAEFVTGVDVDGTVTRMDSLRSGRARTPATALEQAALELSDEPTYQAVANLLEKCSDQGGSRVYRPAISRAAFKALRICVANPSLDLVDAAVQVREENRIMGRQIPPQAIGSTLLLKGLEADHVTVLGADVLNACNLYVALTRGARSVTICVGDARNSLVRCSAA